MGLRAGDRREAKRRRSRRGRLPIANLLTRLGVKVAAHDMSHYSPGERNEASQKRDAANTGLLAGLFDKLKAVPETNGTRLFDRTTVVFGSNLSTVENLTNCPTLITGGGSGIKLGQSIVAPKDTPLCNAWLTLLQGSGIGVERHGDSSGVLKSLIAGGDLGGGGGRSEACSGMFEQIRAG